MADECHRPRVAVSSCLLGEPVRYDGAHKRSECVADQLSAYFDWFSVCPEVGIGMGVPRPPIRLVKLEAGIRVCGVEEASRDVTLPLQTYARQLSARLAGVSGYVFKSRSPSCGLIDVDLFDSGGRLVGQAEGIFSGMIHDLLPGLPLIDEIQLDDPALREDFVRRVYACQAMLRGRV